MGDSTKKLIELLRNNATASFIKQEMGLTNSQLAYRLSLLKYEGYNINTKYFGNGDITLSLANDVFEDNYAKIYTKYNETSLRFLAISDLHYFNKNENRIAIDSAINYCVKNGIHIIFICGDLIDGMGYNNVPVALQAEKFTEVYPFDDSIIHFCVLGNHDFMTLKKENIDFKKVIENRRLDIVPINYLEAKICIKNYMLFLLHPIENVNPIYDNNEKLIHFNIIGHSHITKFVHKTAYVPSLSDCVVTNQKNFHFFPQALDGTLNFSQNGTFSTVVMDQIVMEQTPYIISEHILQISNCKFDKKDLEVEEYPTLVKKR